MAVLEKIVRWRKENRDLYNEQQREYFRKNYIHTINGHIRVNKRPRPNNCEVCGRVKDILHYHHWDDIQPEFGIWVCRPCHFLISDFESGKITEKIMKYLELKNMVEKEIK